MKRYAAIDYSLNSPAICIFEISGDTVAPVEFNFIAQKRAQIGKFGILSGTELPKWETQLERYENNAEWALSIIKRHKCVSVFIEGYSYGSNTSSYTALVENCFMLKFLLHKQLGITAIPFAPGAIKKVATGKGNAKKPQLYAAWIKDKLPDITTSLAAKDDGNPVSDIVDSYFIAKTAYFQNLMQVA